MKATILIGISGAGKTTYVTEKANENSNLIVVSKDNIRKSLIKNYDPIIFFFISSKSFSVINP